MVARGGIEPPPPAFSVASAAAQAAECQQVLLTVSDGGLISRPGRIHHSSSGKQTFIFLLMRTCPRFMNAPVFWNKTRAERFQMNIWISAP
jgi:hypothetical protein